MTSHPIESTVATPSQTVPALALPSTAQIPLDPLWWNDPLGISDRFETCSTAETDADTVL